MGDEGAPFVTTSPATQLSGTPQMSPNCWRAIEDAVRTRPGCRYLEWGSGNSTIAMLRLALGAPGFEGIGICSVESNPRFADIVVAGLKDVFRDASVDGEIRVEPIRYPKLSLLDALRRDEVTARYEAQALKFLWYSRSDYYYFAAAELHGSDTGRLGGFRRYGSRVRGAAAYRYEKVRRAVREPEPVEASLQRIMSPEQPQLRGPTRLVFETDRVQLEYLVVPQLRNRLSPRRGVLDGLYQQYADYVSVPVNRPFDVVLVDGFARTSCLKRVHHEGLVAPGGALFLHDAQRPIYIEGLQLFRPWSFIRGSDAPDAETHDDETAVESVPAPPRLRSGPSLSKLDTVRDRELFHFEYPA